MAGLFHFCLSDSADDVLPVARATPLQLNSATGMSATALAPGAEGSFSATREVELPFLGRELTGSMAAVTRNSAISGAGGVGVGEGAVPIIHAVEVDALHREV